MRRTLASTGLLFCCLIPIFCAAGCSSTGSFLPSPAASTPGAHIEGNIHGGQQPVVGATIQLYAAGTRLTGGGYGIGSTPLITGVLPISDINGNFTITGTYTLPVAASHFYIVATGGSAGPGLPVNSNISMMAVLEGCNADAALSPSLFVNINEVTTAAAVMALSQFMAAPAAGNTGAPAIGAPATAYSSLQNAFATANNLASISTGSSLTHAQSYATSDINALTLNSLADSLAYCVNSGSLGGQCSTGG